MVEHTGTFIRDRGGTVDHAVPRTAQPLLARPSDRGVEEYFYILASVMSASASWISLNINSFWYSMRNCVERLTSTKSVYTFLISSTSTSTPLRLAQTSAAAMIMWME